MNGFLKALYMLPEKFRAAAAEFEKEPVEEIRLRISQKPTVLIGGRESTLNSDPVSYADIERIVEKISGASLHAAAPTMKEGYISYEGLRVGLCGSAFSYKSQLRGFKDFSSLNIRIPREYQGVCNNLIDEIYKRGFKNTLIISSPGLGKTTALREIIRVLSQDGYRIGVVDDRNELSATENGISQFSLGSHSDILVGTAKGEAAMMLLKAMNENIIAMDEISSGEDVGALMQIYGSGVGILASAHAANKDELYKRTIYRKVLQMRLFTYLVTIKLQGSSRIYTAERL